MDYISLEKFILELKDWLVLAASLAALATVLYNRNKKADNIKEQLAEEVEEILKDHDNNKSALTKEHEGLSKEHQGLSKEHQGLSKEHQGLSKEHQGLEKNITEVKNISSYLKDQSLKEDGRREILSKKELKIEETVDQLKALISLLSSSKEENLNLKNEIIELKALNINYENQIKTLGADNRQLMKQITSILKSTRSEQFENESEEDEWER